MTIPEREKLEEMLNKRFGETRDQISNNASAQSKKIEKQIEANTPVKVRKLIDDYSKISKAKNFHEREASKIDRKFSTNLSSVESQLEKNHYELYSGYNSSRVNSAKFVLQNSHPEFTKIHRDEGDQMKKLDELKDHYIIEMYSDSGQMGIILANLAKDLKKIFK